MPLRSFHGEAGLKQDQERSQDSHLGDGDHNGGKEGALLVLGLGGLTDGNNRDKKKRLLFAERLLEPFFFSFPTTELRLSHHL